MNKRIKELKIQACKWASENVSATEYENECDLKFAELIVRECMGLVDGYTYPVQTQSHTIYHIASDTIKQHFEVEE